MLGEAGEGLDAANFCSRLMADDDEELRRAATPGRLCFDWGCSSRETRAWELLDSLAAREEASGHARARRRSG